MLQPEQRSGEGCNTLSHEDCSGYVFSRPIFNIRIVLAMYSVGQYSINTSDMRQSKTFILSTNIDLRSLETEFLIAVCSPTVNYS